MIKCTTVGVEPSKDCYDMCILAYMCGALRAWEKEQKEHACGCRLCLDKTMNFAPKRKGDLISRQDAITIPVLPIEHRKYQTMNLDDAYELGWFDYQKCIEDLPSASPDLSDYSDRLWKLAYERGKADGQPRKGKWLILDSEYIDYAKCNQCGYLAYVSTNFCPNCGSYNGGEQDEHID